MIRVTVGNNEFPPLSEFIIFVTWIISPIIKFQRFRPLSGYLFLNHLKNSKRQSTSILRSLTGPHPPGVNQSMPYSLISHQPAVSPTGQLHFCISFNRSSHCPIIYFFPFNFVHFSTWGDTPRPISLSCLCSRGTLVFRKISFVTRTASFCWKRS